MASTTHENYATTTDETGAATVEVEVERMLPDEVAEQRVTFAHILERRRGDIRPGMLFEDQCFTWDQVVREAEKRAVVLRAATGVGTPVGPADWTTPTGRSTVMARYLLIKHYRGAPEPPNSVPMNEWTPEEVSAHIGYMNDFGDRIRESGEFVSSYALSESGTWVRSDGEGRPPLTEGPFTENKDLVAGGMIIDAATYERALELAAELSAAPGAGGEPIREWLELRPFLEAPAGD